MTVVLVPTVVDSGGVVEEAAVLLPVGGALVLATVPVVVECAVVEPLEGVVAVVPGVVENAEVLLPVVAAVVLPVAPEVVLTDEVVVVEIGLQMPQHDPSSTRSSPSAHFSHTTFTHGVVGGMTVVLVPTVVDSGGVVEEAAVLLPVGSAAVLATVPVVVKSAVVEPLEGVVVVP